MAEHMICPTRFGAEEFPKVLKDAVVASEDERFFSHGALEMRSTARAAWHYFLGNRQGGSTLTQQLARTLFLKKEDSLQRKLLEAVLAVRISARLSRQEIFTRYMNVVPHARNMYGFDGPARYYFGVRVQDLTLAEAALLVGMLPEPNNRDPEEEPGRGIERARSSVIDLMRAQTRSRRCGGGGEGGAEAPHRRRQIAARQRCLCAVGISTLSRPRAQRGAGEQDANSPPDYRLVVYIDAEFQRSLAAQICAIAGKHQAAGVFMRPSGEVLAVSGSCSYSGEWNRADRHRPLDRIDRQAVSADRRARSVDEHARAGLDPAVAVAGLAVRVQ